MRAFRTEGGAGGRGVGIDMGGQVAGTQQQLHIPDPPPCHHHRMRRRHRRRRQRRRQAQRPPPMEEEGATNGSRTGVSAGVPY